MRKVAIHRVRSGRGFAERENASAAAGGLVGHAPTQNAPANVLGTAAACRVSVRVMLDMGDLRVIVANAL